MHKIRLGLVGVGNMGTAILEGALEHKILTPYSVMVYDKFTHKARAFSRKAKVKTAASVQDLFQKTDVILLAMKPQDFASFAAENKIFLKNNSSIISILAGLTTSKIQKTFGKKISIVRAMPNLGAKVGHSMTVLCGKKRPLLSFAKQIFAGCGEVAILPERTFDLVTAISSSGSAYFFYLKELLTDFGIKHGLTKKVAEDLVIQTAIGAALLAKRSTHSCAELRQMVTSKKGTTEAAFKVLERKKFGKIFHHALTAAMKRSRELRK